MSRDAVVANTVDYHGDPKQTSRYTYHPKRPSMAGMMVPATTFALDRNPANGAA
jgi:hypothetical protein